MERTNADAPEFVPNFSSPIFQTFRMVPPVVDFARPEAPAAPEGTSWEDGLIEKTNKLTLNKESDMQEEDKVHMSEPSKSNEAMVVDKEDKISDNCVVQDSCDTQEVSTPKIIRKRALLEQNRTETLNLVFIGHVDAGKSTIGGHLLYLSGMVDKRTLEKYEKEAKEKNRESWYLSWALDTNIEERERGKTVECGRAYFKTKNKHLVLLDAPGHKNYVPSMISGAAQADLAILVISARKGEFETGFERGGQTREHAMLVKTAGTKFVIVLINKMDDPTVNWSEERYRTCVSKLEPFLKKCGFNPKTDVYFMPCSGFTGAFLKTVPGKDVCSWFDGPPLLTYLDNLPSLTRTRDGPLRLPVAEKLRDMGTFITGKIESGSLEKGDEVVILPSNILAEVQQVLIDDDELDMAFAGDNVKVKLKGVEEDNITQGSVLCSRNDLCHVANSFSAQIVVVELKSIMCAGYTAVMHLHTCMVEVSLVKIVKTLDRKTGADKMRNPRFIKQDDVAVVVFKLNSGDICMETFDQFPQMGRFMLRDEGKTIGFGKIRKVLQDTTNAVGFGK